MINIAANPSNVPRVAPMIIFREPFEPVAGGFVAIAGEDDGEVEDDGVGVEAAVMVDDELGTVADGCCTSLSPLNNFVAFTQLFWN